MDRYHLETEIEICGINFSFISRHPIILNGCFGCGQYIEEDQEFQSIMLSFFDNKFLCSECMGKNLLPGSTHQRLYIRLLESSFLYPII